MVDTDLEVRRKGGKGQRLLREQRGTDVAGNSSNIRQVDTSHPFFIHMATSLSTRLLDSAYVVHEYYKDT